MGAFLKWFWVPVGLLCFRGQWATVLGFADVMCVSWQEWLMGSRPALDLPHALVRSLPSPLCPRDHARPTSRVSTFFSVFEMGHL